MSRQQDFDRVHVFMTSMRRARLAGKPAIVAAVLAAALAGALGGPLPAAEADRAAWTSLSRELAAPWPAQQRRDGRFIDAFREDGSSRYGDAMLGLGLLQNAARDRNRRQVGSALRALDATARLYEPWFPTRAFKRWAVATAYNLAKEKLRHIPAVRRSMRRWARWLGHTRLDYIGRNSYENKHLVDALAVLELQRTWPAVQDRGQRDRQRTPARPQQGPAADQPGDPAHGRGQVGLRAQRPAVQPDRLPRLLVRPLRAGGAPAGAHRPRGAHTACCASSPPPPASSPRRTGAWPTGGAPRTRSGRCPRPPTAWP